MGQIWGLSIGGFPHSYGIDPLILPHSCNGCEANLSIAHVLDYKNVGLITTRQNELYGGVTNLDQKVFVPLHMRNYPSYTLVVPYRS